MMYRCDAYGEGIPNNYGEKRPKDDILNPVKVLSYELFELGNTDSLRTLGPLMQIHNPELAKWMYRFIDEMEENGFIDDMWQEDREKFFSKVIEEVSRITGKKIRFCLWLADYEVVKNRYCRNLEDKIDAYEGSDVILSCLGRGGILFGYEEMPQKI